MLLQVPSQQTKTILSLCETVCHVNDGMQSFVVVTNMLTRFTLSHRQVYRKYEHAGSARHCRARLRKNKSPIVRHQVSLDMLFCKLWLTVESFEAPDLMYGRAHDEDIKLQEN